MKLKNYILFLFVSLTIRFFSQAKVGQWQDHLNYNYANGVAKVGNIVYVSNGEGLATYNEDDNSISKLTKIEGLSDVGILTIKKNDYNQVLLVAYKNTNIDIIKPNGSIINISDLKRKNIPGKKYINDIYFKDNIAYLSCGFGIILLDTEKFEVKDLFKIGNGTSFKEIYQVTKTDSAIYAATESGVYYGSTKKNLSNYQNWNLIASNITAGNYNGIINLNGKIIANYSARLSSNKAMADTLWQYDGINWSKYPFKTNSENKRIYDYSKFGLFLINDQSGLQAISATTGLVDKYITDYGFSSANINDVFYEGNSKYWLADGRNGLIKSNGALRNEKISIIGPSNNVSNDLAIKDGNLVIAPINLGPTFTYIYRNTKPNLLSNNEWIELSAIPDTIFDLNCVAIDPKDKNHIAFGSMGRGVVELKNNQLIDIYNTTNSSMIGFNGSNQLWLTGINFDPNSNLWALNSGSEKLVSIKKGNTWINLDFDYLISKQTLSKVIFDRNNKAWIIVARGGGLLVYKDVNTLTPPNINNTKLLNVSKGNGFLPTNDVYSICEDLEGRIWVGTAKGIAVFNNPENVFKNSNFDSQQILIEQDNQVEILLENDVVTAISVDGGNRKWIGTESSGVYCFSPDGQNTIYHFSVDNSPIYSNTINDIVINEITGDVFIATDKGVQSFRTSIIKGLENFEDVHAFPNPVKPGFSGNIYITGLIDEAIVKITDVSGNLVWQTTSQGGQVEWNLKTFIGTKVASGMYLIFCASASGDKSATTKLLVVN